MRASSFSEQCILPLIALVWSKCLWCMRHQQQRFERDFCITWLEVPTCVGINTGVMLFRNTAWSLDFLDELYGYAKMGEGALQDMRQVRLTQTWLGAPTLMIDHTTINHMSMRSIWTHGQHHASMECI